MFDKVRCNSSTGSVSKSLSAVRMGLMAVGMTTATQLAVAQESARDAGSKAVGFVGSADSVLNVLSIAIVAAVVLFAGGQIAFARKRISDVAAVLIAGFLVGAALQIARFFVSP